MSQSPGAETLLKPGEVARMFGVNRNTVTRWGHTGKLRCTSTRPEGGHIRGHMRFYEADIQAILARIPGNLLRCLTVKVTLIEAVLLEIDDAGGSATETWPPMLSPLDVTRAISRAAPTSGHSMWLGARKIILSGVRASEPPKTERDICYGNR